MKHGLFYTVFSWILGRFGYHLSKMPTRKKETEVKTYPVAGE